MTHSNASTLLRELTNNIAARAASLHEARKRPGTTCEVDEETYFYYLEVLPPQFMDARCYCFAEGAESYLLFWRRDDRYFARQLTMAETEAISKLAGIPLPGDW